MMSNQVTRLQVFSKYKLQYAYIGIAEIATTISNVKHSLLGSRQLTAVTTYPMGKTGVRVKCPVLYMRTFHTQAIK